MESVRQKQTASVIQREFSMVLQQEGTYIYGAKPLVTVTRVKMSPDLGEAKIYLSVFNIPDKQSALIELDENLTRLRQLLGERIRKKVRRIPRIQLFLDDTLDEMYRLNQIFNQIEEDREKKNNPPKS